MLRVEPQRAVATLATAWPRRARVTATFPPATPSPSQRQKTGDAEPGLDAMVDSVLQELEQSASLRGAGLTVEVDDPLVHFDVAEGDFGTQSDRQLQAIAVACMAELLGDAASDHEVRWSLQAGARQLLIAAVPRTLMAMLEAAAGVRGIRLLSVQPSLARRWNSFAPTLKAERAVFATTSGRYSVVACVVDQAIRAVSVGPWQDEGDTAQGTSAAQAALATARLDARAARLLASLGIADGNETEHFLVTDDPAVADAAPPPWSVAAPPELAT